MSHDFTRPPGEVGVLWSYWGEMRLQLCFESKTRPDFSFTPSVWGPHRKDWLDFGPVVSRQSWFMTVWNLGFISELQSQVIRSNPIVVEALHAGVCSAAKMEYLCIGFFHSLGRLCHRSSFFILRASHVLAAQLRLKKMPVVNALSSLLIQTDTTGHNGCFPFVWEVSVGAIMYEQLCLLWNIDSLFFL